MKKASFLIDTSPPYGGSLGGMQGMSSPSSMSTPEYGRRQPLGKADPKDIIFEREDEKRKRRMKELTAQEDEEADQVFEDYNDFGDDDSTESEGALQEEEELIKTLQAHGAARATKLEKVLLYLNRQRQKMKVGTPDYIVEDEAMFGVYVDQKDYVLLKQEFKEQISIRTWFAFDVFFGILVLANGIIMGMQTNGTIDAEDTVWRIVEVGFFAAFLAEFLVRLLRGRSCRTTFSDPWALVDLFCLTVSALDQILSLVLASAQGLAIVAVMRVVRLLRLIRLVRLLNLFNELWIMVSGLFYSIEVLFWSITMALLFCYIFAVGLFEVTRDFPDTTKSETAQYYWGSVPRSLLSMAQVATFDGNYLIREYTEVMTHPAFLILFGMFICIVSMAILNLIIGVLLTTTLKNARKDDGYSTVTERLRTHEAIRDLRLVLRNYAISTKGAKIYKGSPLVTREMVKMLAHETKTPEQFTDMSKVAGGQADVEWHLLEDITDNAEMYNEDMAKVPMRSPMALRRSWQSLRRIEGRRSHDDNNRETASIEEYFQNASVTPNDIDEVFDEQLRVTGEERAIAIDDFITSIIWMKGRAQAQQLDMAEVMMQLRYMYRRTHKEIMGVSAVVDHIDEAIRNLEEILDEHRPDGKRGTSSAASMTCAPHGMGVHGAGATMMTLGALDVERKDYGITGGAMSQQEAEILAEERERKRESQRWDAFDMFFGNVVLVNVLVLGLEASLKDLKTSRTRDITSAKFDTISLIWFVIEIAFYGIYVVEAVLRAIFYYQMRQLKDYRCWLGFLPRHMWTVDWQTAFRILRYFPTMLKDKMYCYEIIIILISSLDNFCLRFVASEGGAADAIRLLGLLRLLRVARLVHLVKPLRIIARGFLTNTRLITWTFVLLLCLIYMVAIAMVDLVGKDATDPVVKKYWGHVGDAMLTLLLMATYNDWGMRVDEVAKDNPWALPFLTTFTLIAGLGILNLVTGVMVQAAFNVVTNESREQVSLMMSEFKVEFHKAHKRMHKIWEDRRERNKTRIRDTITVIMDEFRKGVTKQKAQKKKSQRSRSRSRGSSSATLPHLESTTASQYKSLQSWQSGPTDYTLNTSKTMGVTTEVEGSPSPEQEEDEDGDQGDDTAINEGVCEYDKNTHAVVVMSLWVTKLEVAIRYKLKAERAKEDSDGRGNAWDSMLVWEGGSRVADLHFEDVSALSRGLSSVGAAGAAAANDEHTNTEESSGILVFGGLPAGKRFKFRFGGPGFTMVSITPNGQDLNRRITIASQESRTDKRMLEMLTNDGILHQLQNGAGKLYPEFITCAELEDVIQDRKLDSLMESIGLRPEYVLLTFGELNVTGDQVLRVNDVVEGVVRLQREMVGVDVARSKSVMRRWITEMQALEQLADQCREHVATLVRTLRNFDEHIEDNANQDDIVEVEGNIEQLVKHSRMRESHAWLREVLSPRLPRKSKTSSVGRLERSGSVTDGIGADGASPEPRGEAGGEVDMWIHGSVKTPDGEGGALEETFYDLERQIIAETAPGEGLETPPLDQAPGDGQRQDVTGVSPLDPRNSQPNSARSGASQAMTPRYPEDASELHVGKASFSEANELLQQKVESRRETVKRRMMRVNLPEEVITRIFQQASAKRGQLQIVEGRYYNAEDDTMSIGSADDTWE